MPKTKIDSSRDQSLDFVKFVAITLVIMVHLTAVGFLYPLRDWWYAASAYRCISAACVPLFFMATGAMILDRPATLHSILKRIARVGIPLILWSCIYLAWYQYALDFKTGNWLLAILQNRAAAHLWFIYAILGVYIFLPLLTIFYTQSTTGQKTVFLIAWFVGASLNPFSYRLIGHALLAIDLSYAPLYSGYLMLGALLYRWLRTHRERKWMVFCWIVVIAATYMAINMTWDWPVGHRSTTTAFFDYWSPLTVLTTIASFVALQITYDRLNTQWIRSFVSFFAMRTFGIYLSHFLLLQFYFSYAHGDFLYIDAVGAWAWFPIVTAICLLLSGGLSWVLQRIPILKILSPD